MKQVLIVSHYSHLRKKTEEEDEVVSRKKEDLEQESLRRKEWKGKKRYIN